MQAYLPLLQAAFHDSMRALWNESKKNFKSKPRCGAFRPVGSLLLTSSVADPHHIDMDPDADPDPTFHFDAAPDPDPIFQIKAQNLEKVLK
jgi:hypothetical protein